MFQLSDFARLGAFYYLTVLYRDIVAPASDYAVMCVVFFIVIRWLAHLEQKEHPIAPYALLCVAGVYAVTLKLTAGVILLLVIKPAYLLLKEKEEKRLPFLLQWVCSCLPRGSSGPHSYRGICSIRFRRLTCFLRTGKFRRRLRRVMRRKSKHGRAG